MSQLGDFEHTMGTTYGVDDLVPIIVEKIVALGALVGGKYSFVGLVASDDLQGVRFSSESRRESSARTSPRYSMTN